MKIVVPSIDKSGLESQIEEHFGRARYYTFIEVDQDTKEIKNVTVVEAPFAEHGPGDIPRWISENGADTVIVLGIGPRAVGFFESFNIKVISGARGKVKDVVEAYLKGTLETIEWKRPEGYQHRHHHY